MHGENKALPDAIARLYPFNAHLHETGAGRMHFIDEGAGPPVLFVHGNPTWSFFYRNLVIGLRDKHRCLAIDHLGCGLSDKPQNFAYRLQDHADNLRNFIEAKIAGPFHLVVHDWGGPIGLLASMPWQDKLLSATILNTAAFRSRRIPARIAMCRIPMLGGWLVRGLNGFAGAAVHMAVTRPLPPDVRAGYLHPYHNWASRIAVHRFVEDIPLNPKHPSYPALLNLENALPQLRQIPLQIIWGARDFCFNDHFLHDWQLHFPDAPVHYLKDSGHYLTEDAAEVCLNKIAAWTGR